MVNLPPGTYTVTVSAGAGTCTSTRTVTIPALPKLEPTLTSIPAGCAPAFYGCASVVWPNGATGIAYTWSPAPAAGQPSQTVCNLPAGTYYVTATDGNGCTFPKSVTVNPTTQVQYNISTTPSKCNSPTGEIIVTQTGTTNIWNVVSSAPNGTLTGLTAATYDITVTDQYSCNTTRTGIVVNQTTPPSISLNPTPTSCGLDNGSIIANASGTPPYSYQWFPSLPPVPNPNNVPAGDYTVTVTDGNGCTIIKANIDIDSSPPLGVSTKSNPAQCGLSNGSATALTTGVGNTPINYLWSNGSTTVTISGLDGGFYTVTASAPAIPGCEAVDTAEIVALPVVQVSALVEDATCDQPNGSACVINENGVEIKFYRWNNNSPAQCLEDKFPNTFSVTVTDVNMCTVVLSPIIIGSTPVPMVDLGPDVTIPSGSSLTLNASIPNDSLYLWAPGGDTTATLTVIEGGTYTVTVTDIYGCTDTDQITVKVVSASQEAGEMLGLKLFPNPTSGRFTMLFASNVPESITVSNALGQVVLWRQTSGSREEHFEIPGEGVFLVRSDFGNGQYVTKRLVVNRQP